MNIPPRMKCSAAAGIKRAPNVFFRPPRHSHTHFPFLQREIILKMWHSIIEHMSKNICTTKNVSCWCFWMLKFNTVWNHLQEQCLGLEENLQNRRFGGHWGSCGCEHSPPASPTCRSAKAGRVQHGKHCTCLLLQHLLSAPAALEVLLLRPGSATLLSRFGHLNTPLARTASPGEDGGRAWHREIVLPNWRCQAVVGGEPSASVQPASVATARHRWCVWGCCRITKLSLQNTMWILEGTFLDSPDSSTRPLCLYLLMPGWTWNSCFQSSWDRCLWGSLIFWGSNIPTWVRRGAGAWNPREVGGTAGGSGEAWGACWHPVILHLQ